jgi:hypothetical protein
MSKMPLQRTRTGVTTTVASSGESREDDDGESAFASVVAG